MPFTNSNDYITGRKPGLVPSCAELTTVNFEIALTAGNLAANTIGQIGILPAGCIPVECRVYGADLDSGAGAGVYEIGLWDGAGASLSTAAADGNGAWGNTGAAVATAFDKPLTRTLNNMASVVPAQTDRKLGLKVVTAPSTAVAGTIGVALTYRSA
jgi:hypothetical protein